MRDDLTEDGVAAKFKSDRAVKTARRMRKNMSPAELKLWFELRQRHLEGSKFRRQAVMGPFIIDFLCHGARLAIELDGGVHRAPDVALRDNDRQNWIEGRGYKIMRFSNARVLGDASGVADEILVQTRARMRVIQMMREHDPFGVHAA